MLNESNMLFEIAMKYKNYDKNNSVPTERGYDMKPFHVGIPFSDEAIWDMFRNPFKLSFSSLTIELTV